MSSYVQPDRKSSFVELLKNLNPFEAFLEYYRQHPELRRELLIAIGIFLAINFLINNAISIAFLIGYLLRLARYRLRHIEPLPVWNQETWYLDVASDVGKGLFAGLYFFLYVFLPLALLVGPLMIAVLDTAETAGMETADLIEQLPGILLFAFLFSAFASIWQGLLIFLLALCILLPLYYSMLAHMAFTNTPGFPFGVLNILKSGNRTEYVKSLVRDLIFFPLVFLFTLLVETYFSGTIVPRLITVLTSFGLLSRVLDWAKFTDSANLQTDPVLERKKSETFAVVAAFVTIPAFIMRWLPGGLTSLLTLAFLFFGFRWALQWFRKTWSGHLDTLPQHERDALRIGCVYIPIGIGIIAGVLIITNPGFIVFVCLIAVLIGGLILWLMGIKNS